MCAQSKWRGSLLMEWLIVFGISLIILPIIAQTIRTTYQTIRNYIIQINEAIERNERYYTLYKDAQSINTHLNDCCFQTSTTPFATKSSINDFDVKKATSATSYYYHYMGAYAYFESIACSIDQQLLAVTLTKTDSEYTHYFHLVESLND